MKVKRVEKIEFEFNGTVFSSYSKEEAHRRAIVLLYLLFDDKNRYKKEIFPMLNKEMNIKTATGEFIQLKYVDSYFMAKDEKLWQKGLLYRKLANRLCAIKEFKKKYKEYKKILRDIKKINSIIKEIKTI